MSTSRYFWLEVRCDAVRVEQLYWLGGGGGGDSQIPPSKMGGGTGPLEVPVFGRGVCEIKPSRFRSFKSGIAWTDYRIDIVTPGR